MKDEVLPLFKKAWEYEHHNPPSWGSLKLELHEFENELAEHFGRNWINCYLRRELEYKAIIRVYW